MRDSPARTLLATCRYANRPDRNVSFVGFVMRTAIMPTNTILNQEDLRRWRDCPRRFWLHRLPEEPGSTKAQAEPGADAEAVAQAADPKILAPHTGSDQALRATFPQAAVIESPLTPEAWDAAVARTSSLLNEGFLAGDVDATEGRAILGACLRSADAFGAQAVIVPKDRAVGVNATAAKAACGAADTVPVVSVTNLSRANPARRWRSRWWF